MSGVTTENMWMQKTLFGGANKALNVERDKQSFTVESRNDMVVAKCPLASPVTFIITCSKNYKEMIW